MTTNLHELSLFSGYGGFTLGLRLANLNIRTVGYVEIDPYCQRLLQQRIQDGVLDDAPIWPDICTFDGLQCRGVVDIVTAGFPCQPHSHAGRRRGKDDPRDLWPDTLQIIRDVGPSYVVLENVRGLADGADPYAKEVVGGLSEAGYMCRWGLLSAGQVGAPHRRVRWWCVGVADSIVGSDRAQIERGQVDGQDSNRSTSRAGRSSSGVPRTAAVADASRQHMVYQQGGERGASGEGQAQPAGDGADGGLARTVDDPQRDGLADSQVPGGIGLRAPDSPARTPQSQQPTGSGGGGGRETCVEVSPGQRRHTPRPANTGETEGGGPLGWPGESSWWAIEPDVGRVAYGVASRVDRLKALGNGIVPAQLAAFIRSVQ